VLNNMNKTDYFVWTFFIAMILLFIELTFFNGGIIFFLLIAIGCIYIGRRRMPGTKGKVLFWFGLISSMVAIFSLMAFRFLFFALIFYFFIRYMQRKEQYHNSAPPIEETNKDRQEGPLIKRQPIMENLLFGRQTTTEQVYEWNDVNIHGFIGDTVIDLSNTVLPKGEAIILIRNFIGNVQVLVPYEMEVQVNHSAFAGSAIIFQKHEPFFFNRTIHYQTAKYEEAGQKVKILTSMIVGDLEVKRT
jgi:lia operon protein LiaF